MKIISSIIYFLINPYDCILRIKTSGNKNGKEKDKDKENKNINKVLFTLIVVLISLILSALIIITYTALKNTNIIEG